MGNACTNCQACRGDDGENGEILTNEKFKYPSQGTMKLSKEDLNHFA
jgi:hypothetical protein